MGIEYKAVPLSGYSDISTDGNTGIVETIVSVTGVKDNVNDIIEPGAYAKSLEVRTPKGIWSHDWNQPLSKTLEVRELLPGDPDLPATLPNGDAWPSEAGALLVKTEFNLNTQRGRDAYEDVKFFGSDQEWSVGYSVPVGGATIDQKTGIRHINTIDLYEYSPVLFGAMPLARTTSVKSAQEAFKAFAEAKGDGRGDTRWGEGGSEVPGDDVVTGLSREQIEALRNALPVIQSLVGDTANAPVTEVVPNAPTVVPVKSARATETKADKEKEEETEATPSIEVDSRDTAVSLVSAAFPDNDEVAGIARQFDEANDEEATEEAGDVLLNAIEDTYSTLGNGDTERRNSLAKLAMYIANATEPSEAEEATEDEPEEKSATVVLDITEFDNLFSK